MNKNDRREFAKIAASLGEPPAKGLARRIVFSLKSALAQGRSEMNDFSQSSDRNRFLLPSER